MDKEIPEASANQSDIGARGSDPETAVDCSGLSSTSPENLPLPVEEGHGVKAEQKQ